MFSYCTDYTTTMPTITICMNCDTKLAINLNVFQLTENDEFIFVIKNYDYIDSSYAFLFRAKKSDMDENGEVIFKIDPDVSKKIKPGAFYNFALLINAFNIKMPTEYRKLTENGKVIIEYGAHDLALPESDEVLKSPASKFKLDDIIKAHLEPTEEDSDVVINDVITDILIDENK